ncbi:lipoyl domain-containing protein [Spiractinospora alimapuensis]|uniref:biotin/lipoyl-containing protein n=1 Tax=Spiractinospora alimapuensis TaxID=2820884 RepID=UPI001F4154D6|nr:lipoyl domain-containing protein [Spiractinospora alimapuensis]QVQ54460.1 lipoyl domain-containing protein [Spiractinospora alimapuensis]
MRRVRTPSPRRGGGASPSLSRAVFFPVITGGAESERDGVLATWFVPDGAQVTEGERLAQGAIGTQSVDVTAPKKGVVHLLVDQGNAVVQGTPIAFID